MRVILLPQVAKLTRKERILRAVLCQVASDVVAGVLGAGEADLGRGLFKKRVARPGGGKRDGYRMVVAYRPPKTERVPFVCAFAKNDASTLTQRGQEALATDAETFVVISDDVVRTLIAEGEILEVMCDGDE